MISLLALLLSFHEPPGTIQPAWERHLDGLITAAASVSGRCVGAVTASHLIVLGDTGATLWTAALADAPGFASDDRLAISPACDWAAVWTGRPSERVQIVHRDGRTADIQVGKQERFGVTLDIAPDGAYIAVGSNWDQLIVASAAGKVVTQLRVGEHFDQGVDVRFVDDSSRIAVTGQWHVGVVAIEGRWLWTRRTAVAYPSSDLTRFATYHHPSYGPQGGNVALLNERGREIWKGPGLWSPDAAIAEDGSFLVYTGVPMKYFDPARPEITEEVAMKESLRDPDTLWSIDREGRSLPHRKIAPAA